MTSSLALAGAQPSLVEDPGRDQWVQGRVCTGSLVGRQTGRQANLFIWAELNYSLAYYRLTATGYFGG